MVVDSPLWLGSVWCSVQFGSLLVGQSLRVGVGLVEGWRVTKAVISSLCISSLRSFNQSRSNGSSHAFATLGVSDTPACLCIHGPQFLPTNQMLKDGEECDCVSKRALYGLRPDRNDES